MIDEHCEFYYSSFVVIGSCQGPARMEYVQNSSDARCSTTEFLFCYEGNLSKNNFMKAVKTRRSKVKRPFQRLQMGSQIFLLLLQ